jgi:hypothetical protein
MDDDGGAGAGNVEEPASCAETTAQDVRCISAREPAPSVNRGGFELADLSECYGDLDEAAGAADATACSEIGSDKGIERLR